jgi:TP901 family phage tail tape measure protein
MNSLKTIYSRLTTMQPAIDALADIGINVKESNGEMKSASSILESLAKRWSNLNSEQQQNLGVILAGRSIMRPSNWVTNWSISIPYR